MPRYCLGHAQVADVLKLAQQKSLYPMIIFSFARIECEGFAMFVINEGKKTNSLDFTTEEEKATIEEVCRNCKNEDSKNLCKTADEQQPCASAEHVALAHFC